MQNIPDYMHFWGKAQPASGEKTCWHPLAWHSLDVAAVAQLLQQERENEIRRICERIGAPPDAFVRFNTFLIALHDVGKFSRAFQALVPQLWPAQVLGDFDGEQFCGSHWQISHELLANRLRMEVLQSIGLDLDEKYEDIEPLIRAVAGHHGRPPSSDTDASLNQLCEQSIDAARQFIDHLATLLGPFDVRWIEHDDGEDSQKAISFWLAGLAVAADWLGSNREVFRYEPPEHTLKEYWRDVALPRAWQAIARAGIASPSPARQADYPRLFGINTPRPMQEAVARLDLPEGPVLVVIEDATGSGKTEAATLLALRMMHAGKGNGLFFALPTMATANAMFARMGRHYRNLFGKETRPSLALAHSRRALHDDWFSAVKLPEHMTQGQPGNEETAIQCARWIADDRRKTFFAHVGVGTIDQALLAVLPSKFQSLRLWGLADRILVVDEAHAYDAYMSRELETLLEFHAANGGSAIILSATLPSGKRRDLARAFMKGTGLRNDAPTEQTERPEEIPYPLITLVTRTDMRQVANIKPAPDSIRRVQVQRLADEGAAIAAIAEASRRGAAVAWVRNAVDDAIRAVQQLRQHGIHADLFHARFAMGDRQRIETDVVSRFGRNGSRQERAGRVLVATQVIEQSLDLDFDLMISDLAPVDLLIQRAGRLWRHMDERPAAERPVPGPRLLIVSPDPDQVEDGNWLYELGHRGAHVYENHALLWRTARKLFDRGGFNVPDDLRDLVEYAYQIPGDCPAPLADMDEKAEGVIWGDRASASFNLLSLEDGYAMAGSWLEEDAVHTRLGEKTRTIRLARIDGDRLLPRCEADSEPRAWALSEVSCREDWLQGAQTAAAWQAEASRIHANWPEWQRHILIAPVSEDGQLLLDNLPHPLRYDNNNGLERLRKNG